MPARRCALRYAARYYADIRLPRNIIFAVATLFFATLILRVIDMLLLTRHACRQPRHMLRCHGAAYFYFLLR